MSKQQTAVEWLEEQIKDYDFSPASNTEDYVIVIPIWILKSKVQQAKAMEKEQIKDAYKFGIQDEYVIGSENYYRENYYIETYENHST
jgi:hypothetical protein